MAVKRNLTNTSYQSRNSLWYVCFFMSLPCQLFTCQVLLDYCNLIFDFFSENNSNSSVIQHALCMQTISSSCWCHVQLKASNSRHYVVWCFSFKTMECNIQLEQTRTQGWWRIREIIDQQSQSLEDHIFPLAVVCMKIPNTENAITFLLGAVSAPTNTKPCGFCII